MHLRRLIKKQGTGFPASLNKSISLFPEKQFKLKKGQWHHSTSFPLKPNNLLLLYKIPGKKKRHSIKFRYTSSLTFHVYLDPYFRRTLSCVWQRALLLYMHSGITSLPPSTFWRTFQYEPSLSPRLHGNFHSLDSRLSSCGTRFHPDVPPAAQQSL